MNEKLFKVTTLPESVIIILLNTILQVITNKSYLKIEACFKKKPSNSY